MITITQAQTEMARSTNRCAVHITRGVWISGAGVDFWEDRETSQIWQEGVIGGIYKNCCLSGPSTVEK